MRTLLTFLITGLIASAQNAPVQGVSAKGDTTAAAMPDDYLEQLSKLSRAQGANPDLAEIVPDPANSQPLRRLQPVPGDLPDRGLNHERITWVEVQRDVFGHDIAVTNSYVQLEPGINFLNAKGQLEPAVPAFEIQNGVAVAERLQHKVRISGNLKAGGIEVEQPDGLRLNSSVAGLSYHDLASGKTVVISEMKSSEALLVSSNQVVFPDAFASVRADVRYTVTKGGFEQDILLLETPPDPAEFGLDPDTTRLEVMTEFEGDARPEEKPLPAWQLTSPGDSAEALRVALPAGPEAEDRLLDFGAMTIGLGRAFPVDAAAARVPVYKQWYEAEGRRFLIEAVDLPVVLPELQKRGKGEAQAIPGRSLTPTPFLVVQQSGRPLPARHSTPTGQARIQTAPADTLLAALSRPLYVLDYNFSLSGVTQTNFTFKGNETYYTVGWNYFYGQTVFEAGAVIKSPPFDWSNTNYHINEFRGPVDFQGSAYRPVVFTASDDNAYGGTISGSTGIPGGTNGTIRYGTHACYFNTGTPSVTVKHANFLYRNYAAVFANSATNELRHSRLLACAVPTSIGANTAVKIRNALEQVCTYVVEYTATTGQADVQHLTADGVWQFIRPDTALGQLSLKNSLLTGTASTSSYTDGGGNVVLSSSSGVFQTVWGGYHYLPSSSPYRRAGLTTIDPALTADLREMTTQAPLVLTGALTAGTVLSPYVTRETGAFDIGYHYPAIDYVFSNAVVQGGTVTLTNGVSIAYGWNCAFDLQNGAVLVSEGRPERLNRIVRQQLVQDWPLAGDSQTNAIAVFKANTSASTLPILSLRFTEINTLGLQTGSPTVFLQSTQANSTVIPLQTLSLSDCQFGGLSLQYFPNTTAALTMVLNNNVFDRCGVNIGKSFSSGSDVPLTVSIRNNLFRQSGLALVYNYGNGFLPDWTVMENVFDNLAPSFSGDMYGQSKVVRNYNGYINASSTSFGGANNQSTTNFVYQTGPLGNYYQASTTFVNAGSRTGGAAGLYHYTTQASQTKEQNTTVDLGFHYVATEAYLASSGFSSTQGANGWWYMYAPALGQSAGYLTNYSTPSGWWYNWTSGLNQYCLVWNIGQHPGYDFDSIRAFTVPKNAQVWVTGTALSSNTACGVTEGTSVAIRLNSTWLTPWISVPNGTNAVPVSAVGQATAGDLLSFQLNKATSNVCDGTLWDPLITLNTPKDSDGDGALDYLEDRNGNGTTESGETNWNDATDRGLGVWITRPNDRQPVP